MTVWKNIMDLIDKLAVLDQIYRIYDNFVSGLELACKKYCAHCCTTGVTLTTLEGYKIIQQLESEGKAGWVETMELAAQQPYFQLKITTNQLASLCAEGIDPPAEESAEWNPCPLLTDSQCPIYAVRPYGCRCLVSRHDCGIEGYAHIDDFVLSVNTVFLQTIEHLDAGGCSGNLIDVLRKMAPQENRNHYENNRLKCANAGLISNQPLKALMIPPEHRSRIEPILQSLRDIRI
jgi:Fe-S-cluster containining protein